MSSSTLHPHLSNLSELISESPSSNSSRCLASISQTHLAVLISPTLHLLPLNPKAAFRPSTLDVPADANALHPAHDALAVTSPRSIHVLHRLSNPVLLPVAEPLFKSRPSLKVVDVAWSPHAHAFLAVLTSDSCIRLYDVVSDKSAQTERWRLPVPTVGAPPVSIAFGRGTGWDSLAIYILCEDGALYVCAPIAPIGTSLPYEVWKRLRDTTRKQVDCNVPSQPKQTKEQLARQLRFIDEGDNDDDNEMSWQTKQASMQLRFLNTFERAGENMIVVSEFKPAPLLIQGPLYVEHDDVLENTSYCSLTLISCASAPPVLLRCSTEGHVSVLIELERVEPQWFLSSDLDVQLMPANVHALAEYSEVARAVAPALLAFEHLTFGCQVNLIPLGRIPDADVVFAATRTTIYSVRLSFLSVMAHEDALHRSGASVITPFFSAPSASERGVSFCGVTASFARGEGPVAIVLTSEGALWATAALRWVSDVDAASIARLLNDEPGSSEVWDDERGRNRRGVACGEAARDVGELLKQLEAVQRKHVEIAPMTLGRVSEVKSFGGILAFLEHTVEVSTGGENGGGVGDTIGQLASGLFRWSDELSKHVVSTAAEVEQVRDALGEGAADERWVRSKMEGVIAGSAQLERKVRTLKQRLDSCHSELSSAERERYARLREKRLRVMSLRRRIEELSAAVSARARDGHEHNTRSIRRRVRTSVGSARSPAMTRDDRRMMTQSARLRARWSKDGGGMLQGHGQTGSAGSAGSAGGVAHVRFSTEELQQLRSVLETHSAEIGRAMESGAALWKRLSVG